jgi:prepilin-type N-terminal cleavage/methylation domain-containing protein
MKRSQGVTLIELLLVVVMMAILMAAITRAYSMGLQHQIRADVALQADEERIAFEDTIKELLRGAYLSEDPDDLNTFFIASNSGLGREGPDTISFSAVGLRPPAAYLRVDDDWENLNTEFGPQGGVAEVGFSMTPVGFAGDRQGLFVRRQTPADTDPFQGGIERLLNGQVESLYFEFFNGASWVTDWDTTGQPEKRLPAAVRVTYRFEADDQDRSFVVALPLSDVTPEDPLGVGGTL